MGYLIAAVIGLVALYGGAWLAGYVREWWMLSKFISRLPQTPEEWEAERERDWEFLTRMIEGSDNDKG